MMLRKPTIPECVQLTRDAARLIADQIAQGDASPPFEIAFHGLGDVAAWLHPQSRNGIAAMAASYWRAGVEPYAEFSIEELKAVEEKREGGPLTGRVQ